MRRIVAMGLSGVDVVGAWVALLGLRIVLEWEYFDALAIGLGTRFFGASLFILTIVAIASAHWPADGLVLGDLLKGYVISDKGYGNFKLPLIFLAMLVPLILSSPGKLSLDALIRRKTAAC